MTVAHYAAMKRQVQTREVTFEETLELAFVHYGVSVDGSGENPAATLDSLFDPVTGLLRPGFSVPDSSLSLAARSELETLRGAQLRLFGQHEGE